MTKRDAASRCGVVVDDEPMVDPALSDQWFSVDTASDAVLVCAMSRGRHEAFAEIYARHGGRVYGLARRICGASRADDIVQEVFLQLWNHPERFNPDRGSLQSYLLMQSHSRSVDSIRSGTARRARESADIAAQRVAVVTDVDVAALARLAGQAAVRLMEALPDGEHEAIVLAYFGGHTYREVAKILGLPEGTVKSRIRHGLGRLYAELADANLGSSMLPASGWAATTVPYAHERPARGAGVNRTGAGWTRSGVRG